MWKWFLNFCLLVNVVRDNNIISFLFVNREEPIGESSNFPYAPAVIIKLILKGEETRLIQVVANG
jgi:hypothetical protein